MSSYQLRQLYSRQPVYQLSSKFALSLWHLLFFCNPAVVSFGRPDVSMPLGAALIGTSKGYRTCTGTRPPSLRLISDVVGGIAARTTTKASMEKLTEHACSCTQVAVFLNTPTLPWRERSCAWMNMHAEVCSVHCDDMLR